MDFFQLKFFFFCLPISGLVPALAAESVHGGESITKGAKTDMMAEIETVREEGCQRTRDMAGPARNLGQNHVPGPDLGLDQKTINAVSLSQNRDQNHGPDPEKGGKTTHDCNNHLSPPNTRGSRSQKTRGDAGLDPAQEREGKKKDHRKLHRKLQAPVFYPQKTQNSYSPRKKRRILFNASSKKKKLLWRKNRRLPPVSPLQRKTKTSGQTARPLQQKWPKRRRL